MSGALYLGDVMTVNHLTTSHLVCLQPVFSLRVTWTPELRRVFSHRERKRAVWQFGRVGKKACAAPMSCPILLKDKKSLLIYLPAEILREKQTASCLLPIVGVWARLG